VVVKLELLFEEGEIRTRLATNTKTLVLNWMVQVLSSILTSHIGQV
jgi:hypothetical protein